MRYHFTATRMAIHKKTNNSKCWWQYGEIGTLIHYWWEHKMVYNQEIWIHMSTHKNPYINIHSNIIHSSQKVEKPKRLSADEWINKMCYIHTGQYYLAVKRNKVQIHVITWIKLESNMLNEKISQNTTY